MSYTRLNTDNPAQEILKRLMNTDDNVLLIPPKYKDKDPIVSDPPSGHRMIGLFSSGSTGRPKCIWNRYDRLLLNASRTAIAFQVTDTDRMLFLAAPWHVAGLSWGLMAEQLGAEYHFLKTVKGEKERWYEAVTSIEPDCLFTVPAVLRSLYDEDWFVQKIIYGGSPLQYHELKLLHPHCKYLVQGYGQTEAGGLIAAHIMVSGKKIAPDEHLCCGMPIHGAKIRCEGSIEEPAAIYLHSESAYTDDWYATGDLGYTDDQGRIYVVGRKDALIQNRD